jgi:hypothetical protein
MSANTNSDWRITIKNLLDLRPHNGGPLFETVGTYDVNGAYTQRLPIPRGMTPLDWGQYDCRIYTCRILLWEYTPGGTRHLATKPGTQVHFEHMHMIGDNDYSHRFGSCMACWKTQARKFDDTNITSFPSQVGLDDPNLPRLGRCGCTICNNCVRLLEQRCGNADACPCPYCGNLGCFFKEIKIWSIGHEVFMEEVARRRAAKANVN